jgi:hypothetical protein
MSLLPLVTVEPCSCDAAGWCPRHNMTKGTGQFKLCRERDDYRAMWDAQANPFCTEWEPAGEGVYRCKRCGRPAGSHSPASLPKNRLCVPTKEAARQIPAPEKKGCCGQGTPMMPKPTVVAVAPAKPPELPPLSERVRNLVQAAAEFAKSPELCTREEVVGRLKVCDEPCPKLNGHFCSVCGCWLATATKLKTKHCPMGKWPGDDKGWKPLVHESWLKQTLAVVIHYGDVTMTQDCVRDCQREPVRVLVIDNQGTYKAVGKEEVFTLERNIGWGAACNLAIDRVLVDKTVQGVALLNNDIRLSPNFFSGLIVAQQVAEASIVAPVYNAGWPRQRSPSYFGPAEGYKPKPVHTLSGYCDGTAVFLSREVLEQCGRFDLDFSPRFGWGLIMDYAVRAKEAGHKVAITEAAYVYHHGMQAAEKVHGTGPYVVGAKQEMEEGRKRKYGDEWGRKLNSVSGRRQVSTFNLIYHVTPISTNDEWKRNVATLRRYWDRFNGKKIVAIAIGKHGDSIFPPRFVEAELPGAEFIHVPNDSAAREAASFVALLDAVKSTDSSEATFYAHTKGVTLAGNRVIRMWRRRMYLECLRDLDRVVDALSRVSCCGAFRRIGQFPNFPPYSKWHFSGTFFWFRNDDFFSHPRWREVDRQQYGVEAHLSKLFPLEQSECLFNDRAGGLYSLNHWQDAIILPSYKAEL